MSKLIIPQGLKGKDLFKYLVENKTEMILEKKSILKKTESVVASAFIIAPTKTTTAKNSGSGDAGSPISDSVEVKVVMNTANWCDSAMDVLLDDCWKKTIKERMGMIPHLADHKHEIGAKIGKVKSIYSQDMKLKDLGIDMSGSTQVLIFETEVMKSYNEFVYNQYKDEEINQHSIGLMYVLIVLCINDKDYGAEFEAWQKYYDKVINKDKIDERGYFWAVPEIRLLEGSCVLFGCNELTPTLEVSGKSSTESQPPASTGNQPHPTTEKAYDYNQLLTAFKND
jgi:hypothetical protein